MTDSEVSRFLIKVDRTESCWIWKAQITGGYGKFYYRGGPRLAHRIAYSHWVGPIPTGLTIDHLCRNTACVNPDHLEAVTMIENIRRGTQGWNHRTKTHCSKGHPYDEENTYQTNGNGRACRACHRQWTKEYNDRQKV